MNLRSLLKKTIRPIMPGIIRGLHTKIYGKQIFINRYTSKIPALSEKFKKIEQNIISAHTMLKREQEFKKWYQTKKPTKNMIISQRKAAKKYKHRPLISIILPTYNTKPKYLKACIESVISQSYINWELCIADDASTNKKIVEIIEKYSKQDNRIKYTKRKKNGHICRASNSALKLASGDFIALLDHDDVLWPNALYETIVAINKNPDADFLYSDEDKIDENGKTHSEPFFKPDWSPEFLRSINYITHFAVIRRSLVEEVGGFRPGYEGAQDWDLFLRISRNTNKIIHIPTILYSWRKSETSTAQASSAKDYAYANQKKVLVDDIKSRGLNAEVDWQIPLSMWRIIYKVKAKPLVSIIIPTKDQFEYIERCLKSIKDKTSYDNIEVVIVDTGSTDNRVWGLYEEYKKYWKHLKILKWDKKFNFAAVCNYGADNSKGDYFVFLNNDTEVITPSWVGDMLGYAQQEGSGAIGCHLIYPDGKLQHGGVILGVGGQNGTPGIAGHLFPGFSDQPPQDPMQLLYDGGTRNFSAVTAACVMINKDKFYKVKGFNPKFRIAFNDIDFCLKLLKEGWRNIYLPHVSLFHHESVSVGQPGSKVRDPKEFEREINMMLKYWKPLIKNDPYYHPEFRRDIASTRINIRP